VEVELAQGHKATEVCRKLGISEQTYCRWRKQYGGLRLDHARRLRELEKENQRLKRVVANQALDIVTLKEVASGNF
jgi:transposase-like protein